MILKLYFWSHFQKLWILLIYCSIIIFLLWAFDFGLAMMFLGIIIAGVLIIPTMIIHLNHYKYCEEKTVVLLDDMIRIEGTDPIYVVEAKDIACVTVYMSGARYSNLSIQSFPFENYFYCRIDTKSKSSIYLSSLFSDELDKLLEDRYKVPFVRERKYYPIIS